MDSALVLSVYGAVPLRRLPADYLEYELTLAVLLGTSGSPKWDFRLRHVGSVR